MRNQISFCKNNVLRQLWIVKLRYTAHKEFCFSFFFHKNITCIVVIDSCMTLSQQINYSTWKSNTNLYSTWNSNSIEDKFGGVNLTRQLLVSLDAIYTLMYWQKVELLWVIYLNWLFVFHLSNVNYGTNIRNWNYMHAI